VIRDFGGQIFRILSLPERVGLQKKVDKSVCRVDRQPCVVPVGPICSCVSVAHSVSCRR